MVCATGADRLAARERVEHLPGEIVPVPRAEEGAGPDDQRLPAGRRDRALRLALLCP